MVMSLDDALALAGHVLAAYAASGPADMSGPDLLWADQLARALRELADAVSVRHVTPVGGRPVAVIRKAGQAGGGAAQPGGRRAGRPWSGLARVMWGRPVRVPEAGAVVLSAAEADVAGQALADAGVWHVVYGDCAACVGDGVCADPGRHRVIAVAYAALLARLAGEAR